jgi:hypothetical protein
MYRPTAFYYTLGQKRCADVYLCGQAHALKKSSQVLRRAGIALHGKWNHNFTILNYNVTWALENYSGGIRSLGGSVLTLFKLCMRVCRT